MSETKSLKSSALHYASMGWKVFPLRPGAKTPATRNGFKDATTDYAKIESWWTSNPDYNIGFATGDNLFVIDVDKGEGKDGDIALRNWQIINGQFPVTSSSETPRGGKHYFFRSSEAVKSRVGVFEGIDVRGQGGYVVLPPSTVKGKAYQWIDPPSIVGISEANENVLAFAQHGSKKPANADTEAGNRSDDEPEALPAILTTSDDGKSLGEILAAFAERGITLPPWAATEVPEGKRTDTLVRLLGFFQGIGLADFDLYAVIRAFNAECCNPPLEDSELVREVFPALARWVKGSSPQAKMLALLCELREIRPEQRFKWSDAGNAELFAELSADRFKYVHQRRAWYVYRGKVWEKDTTNQSYTADQARSIGNALSSYTADLSDEKIRAEYKKFVGKWQTLKTRETILRDSATLPRLCLGVEAFDQNPYLLNCLNGTLDLRAADFWEHDPGDLLSRISGVSFDPTAKCDRWIQFIDEITEGDVELARYIQKILGYCLSGDTSRECFFIAYGPMSRNGKGVLVDVFSRLLGDYASAASPETLALRKNSDSRLASGDIARLQGSRFVAVSEPGKDLTLNVALVKQLSGGDTVTARALYESEIEFKPQFKLFIATNHLPYVSDSTLFTSDRLKVIPFNRHFSERERDPELKRKLTTPEALSGVLNWALEGWKMLQSEGLTDPPAVKQAINDYQSIADKVGCFVADQLQSAENKKTPLKQVYTAYQYWCGEAGLRPEGISEFLKSLASAGIITKRARPDGAERTAAAAQMIIGYKLKNS